MEAIQEAAVEKNRHAAYDELNKSWPADTPIPTDAEAIAGARLLIAEGFRYYEKPDPNKKRKFKITSGNRHTWPHGGTFMVNPNYRWRPGWPGMVHSISHYVHSRCTSRKAHEMHLFIERHLVGYAIEKGFHLGKLARPKKEKPPVVVQKLSKVDAAIKKWKTKEKRAATALKKLERQKRYYEKRQA